MKTNYTAILKTYMQALGKSDYDTIKHLFSPTGRVISPFLGDMNAQEFFTQLSDASSQNVITPIDIFISTTEKPHAIAYFQYDWTVKDGTLISFKVMDLFSFEADSDKIELLELIYDTHPIRSTVGNKYED